MPQHPVQLNSTSSQAITICHHPVQLTPCSKDSQVNNNVPQHPVQLTPCSKGYQVTTICLIPLYNLRPVAKAPRLTLCLNTLYNLAAQTPRLYQSASTPCITTVPRVTVHVPSHHQNANSCHSDGQNQSAIELQTPTLASVPFSTLCSKYRSLYSQ